MGRMWVWMILCCSQIQYRHMVTQKKTRGLFGLCKRPQDLIASEREECGYGKDVGEYDTLLQSDICLFYI
jgi:hypothetical protein